MGKVLNILGIIFNVIGIIIFIGLIRTILDVMNGTNVALGLLVFLVYVSVPLFVFIFDIVVFSLNLKK